MGVGLCSFSVLGLGNGREWKKKKGNGCCFSSWEGTQKRYNDDGQFGYAHAAHPFFDADRSIGSVARRRLLGFSFLCSRFFLFVFASLHVIWKLPPQPTIAITISTHRSHGEVELFHTSPHHHVTNISTNRSIQGPTIVIPGPIRQPPERAKERR